MKRPAGAFVYAHALLGGQFLIVPFQTGGYQARKAQLNTLFYARNRKSLITNKPYPFCKISTATKVNKHINNDILFLCVH